MAVAKLVAPTAGVLTKTIGRARSGTAMAAPLRAPRTSFNGTITGHRTVALADLSLDKIKEIKNAVEGATVNDVVLTLCGGALRRYLDERGELPETSLVASVPVSVRGKSKKQSGSNKVSTIFSRLGTDIEDPLERLAQVSEGNTNAKDHHKAIPADTLQDWAEFAAPRTFGLAVRMVSSLRLADTGPVIHNLVISNVPGPPVPLYFIGAKIEGLYPLGPVFHGAGLNITVMSSDGKVHVGAIACRELVPQPWKLTEKFPEELDALHAAATSGRKPKKAASREEGRRRRRSLPRRSRAKKAAGQEDRIVRSRAPDCPALRDLAVVVRFRSDRSSGCPDRSVRSATSHVSRCRSRIRAAVTWTASRKAGTKRSDWIDAAGVAAGGLVHGRAGDPGGEAALARRAGSPCPCSGSRRRWVRRSGTATGSSGAGRARRRPGRPPTGWCCATRSRAHCARSVGHDVERLGGRPGGAAYGARLRRASAARPC